MTKKIPKSTQQSNRSADNQTILKPGAFVAPGDAVTIHEAAEEAAMANATATIRETPDEPVGKKRAQTLVKAPSRQFVAKPSKRLVNNPPQRLVESPQRIRREDDPSSWRVGFN